MATDLMTTAPGLTLGRRTDLRNIAIIAHVDHGKTTLVDALLHQSGQFRESQLSETCILDSNDLERERGITILAKNIALMYGQTKINLIDTPGHADFGGEVERVLRMADGCLVLVDAAEGPMPQTRFVLSKAFECKVRPIVVINKVDRPDARVSEVLDETFSLFIDMGADDELADFPYVFASGRDGYASTDPKARSGDMKPLLDMVLKHVPGPLCDVDAPLQLLATNLDWSEYVGRIGVGRIMTGRVRRGQNVTVMRRDGGQMAGKVLSVHVFEKLGRAEVEEATAGDIAAIVGLEKIEIGDTICDPLSPVALPRVEVDPPTLQMVFSVNNSPFAGRVGKYVTTRNIRDRLDRELEKNVALRVEQVEGSDAYAVSGRGVLHLSVLIETMRREGYELSVGKPEVINRIVNGVVEEPYETLVVEAPDERVGTVMDIVGRMRGELQEMHNRGRFTYLSFTIPARGLIGMRTRLLNASQGEAIMHHRFLKYAEKAGELPRRSNGVLVSMVTGKAIAFGLDGLQERAELFVAPGDDIYEGMVVGENSREGDMIVNPCREKKLTNIRAAGRDDNILLKPPRTMSLEQALEYIAEDELVEVTPKEIRLRKRLLTDNERKRANKK